MTAADKTSPINDNALFQTATDSLHQLFWTLRIDQLGTWSKTLEGMAQIDLHILKLIAAHPNIILKEICAALNIPSSTLTSAINRLEERGLLRRVVSKRDRRSYELELTDQGWKIEKEHERVDRKITEKILKAFDDEHEARTFIELLAKACRQMK